MPENRSVTVPSCLDTRCIAIPLLAWALGLGCSVRREQGVDPVASTDGAPGGTIGDTGADAGDAGDGGDGDKLDVGPGAGGEAGDNPTDGCQKIDFLFVVDNSVSMEGEQENLRAAFPAFMETINDTLEAAYYHVMVIGTDDGYGSGYQHDCGGGDCTCAPAPLCCESACEGELAKSCLGFECDELPPIDCEDEWGAGRTYSGEGQFCGIDGGRRYMLHTQADLDATFACASNVGVWGAAGEKPMLSMTSALAPEINGPGGCNEGFLRDDAILVVTLITDEEDDLSDNPNALPGSPGSPAEWIDALVTAKGGNAEAVVFLALVGDGNRENAQCALEPNGNDGAEAAPRLQAVADGLPFGLVGSVCAPNYDWFFESAVSVIDASCEVFVPQG